MLHSGSISTFAAIAGGLFLFILSMLGLLIILIVALKIAYVRKSRTKSDDKVYNSSENIATLERFDVVERESTEVVYNTM